MDTCNIKLTLSYDGTNYNGYQSQLNGITIEDNLKDAITKITSKKIKLYCAGRTDAGVHAEGQVVNFTTDKVNMNEENWLLALNSILPHDIRILKCEFVSKDFHARKSAFYREYWYYIINDITISALKNRYSVLYINPLKIDLLQEYCNVLIGEHDFTSFTALKDRSKSKIRFIHSIKVEKENNLIIIKFIANSFLHKMIRNIIGTLIKLHRFEKPSSELVKILGKKDRRIAGPTFSPRGLIFKKVYYKEISSKDK